MKLSLIYPVYTSLEDENGQNETLKHNRNQLMTVRFFHNFGVKTVENHATR